MQRRRMLWQLFPSFVLIVVVAVGAVYLYTRHSYASPQMERVARDLEVRARLIEPHIRPHLNPPDVPKIDSLTLALGRSAEARITVVLPDGRVMGDSEGDPRRMERHDLRQEIAAALKGETATAVRYSNTLQRRLVYLALPVYEGNEVVAVVRIAVPESAVGEVIGSITGSLTGDIFVAGALILLLAAGLSLLISRSVSRPLAELHDGADRFARGELSYTLPVVGYEEIGGLAEAMNQMAAQLNDRIDTISRQRNEQEAILTAMVEGVMAVDAAERILTINAAAARLFGVEIEAAIGRSVHEVARYSELHRLVSETLRSDLPIEGTIELTGIEERQLQVHGTTLRDGSGNRAGGVIVLNDVTRLRRLENVRREFVANVSHELRTPITSIKGFLETLSDGAIDRPEDARRFLDILVRQANQLNNIIEDLLALSRLEQSRDGEGFELARQQIGRVLRSSMQVCDGRAKAKDIRIEIEDDGKLMAAMNATLLEQAVVNLLNNAITYSPSGSTVRIGACRTATGVGIFVSDEGPGIEPQHLGRIFERFYRVDKARSRNQGGTGLGLAIVKHIALAHNGRVTVKSTVGAGSTFTIHLPEI